MRNFVKLLAVPALAIVAACGGNQEPRVDDALKSDLALAATAQPYGQQQFVSPQEMGYAGQQGYMPMQPQQYDAYGRPVYQPAPQPVRTVYRTAPTATRRSTGSTAQRIPSGTVTRRNTKRDAVIGGVSGAVIGAATSRDRVKGGLIGAAAGAVLGGVIGHTVDVERAP
jgi:hypothetical protein